MLDTRDYYEPRHALVPGYHVEVASTKEVEEMRRARELLKEGKRVDKDYV